MRSVAIVVYLLFALALVPPVPTDAASASVWRIQIPSIGLNRTVTAVASTDDVTRGVDWWNQSSVSGEQGNIILWAHNYGAFRNLRRLRIGSVIVLNRSYRYVVTERYLIRGNLDTSPLDQTDDERVTLLTCAGWLQADGLMSHRLVVVAQRVR